MHSHKRHTRVNIHNSTLSNTSEYTTQTFLLVFKQTVPVSRIFTEPVFPFALHSTSRWANKSAEIGRPILCLLLLKKYKLTQYHYETALNATTNNDRQRSNANMSLTFHLLIVHLGTFVHNVNSQPASLWGNQLNVQGVTSITEKNRHPVQDTHFLCRRKIS